ncbi:MAG: hypothetical protein JRJ59_01900, partial [Deltaproteobacteria bacterium]|nr:hypothetical protein [Deltaproteobacteria bacterium]
MVGRSLGGQPAGPGFEPRDKPGPGLFPRQNVLGQISLRLATYTRQASGQVRLALLRGSRPPADKREAARRQVAGQTIDAARLKDNQVWRWGLPGFKLEKDQGLFLVVSRPAGGRASPVTVWLDSDRRWTGPQAVVLRAGPGGRLEAAPVQGHLSLALGYDRPSLSVFIGQRAWGPWAWGLFTAALAFLSLRLWPGLAGRLRPGWQALIAGLRGGGPAQEPKPGPARRRLLPLAVLAAGLVFSVYLQTLVKGEVFYSGDAGLKVLMTAQLASGRLKGDLRLQAEDWVGRVWNQGLYPFEPPFVQDKAGRRYLAFPLIFPLVSAPLYAAFGFRGLYLLPLLAAWLLWFRLYAVGLRLGLSSQALALGLTGLVLASPLTLYSTMVWEHTLAVCLAFWGLSLVILGPGPEARPRTLAAGGLLIGLAVWFRAETVCLAGAAALLVPVLAQKGRRVKAT